MLPAIHTTIRLGIHCMPGLDTVGINYKCKSDFFCIGLVTYLAKHSNPSLLIVIAGKYAKTID